MRDCLYKLNLPIWGREIYFKISTFEIEYLCIAADYGSSVVWQSIVFQRSEVTVWSDREWRSQASGCIPPWKQKGAMECMRRGDEL